MVEDRLIWNGVKQRITSKMSNEDFKTMCRLHAKYLTINIINLALVIKQD